MRRSAMLPTAAAPSSLLHGVINEPGRGVGEGNPRSSESGRGNASQTATLSWFQRAEIKAAKRCFDERHDDDWSWKRPAGGRRAAARAARDKTNPPAEEDSCNTC